MFDRLISLDAYRKRKNEADSATIALARLEHCEPAYPEHFLADHRLAFLASSEHHDARALCLLLNRRPISAGLHHLSSLIFRYYAQSDAIARLTFIWAHLTPTTSTDHTVHIQTTVFFRAIIEAFYREHSQEVNGATAGRFTVVDDVATILALFHSLGYEHRYNAVLATYNASLSRSDINDQQLVKRKYRPSTS